MRLIYTAKRNLAPGHTLEEEYEIARPHEDALPTLVRDVEEQRALNGTSETDLNYTDRTWTIITDHITNDAQLLAEHDEFFASVSVGEIFIFDPDSDVAGVDVNPLSCKMVSKSFPRRRTGPLSFKYSFKVREL